LFASFFLVTSSFSAPSSLDGGKLLKASLDYSGSLVTSSFSGEVKNIFDDNGTGRTNTHTVDVMIKRPDKLKVTVKGDAQNREYFLNSWHFSVVDAPLFVYGEIDVPADIDEALVHVFKKFNMNPPMGSLVYSNKHPRPTPEKVMYLGEEEAGGFLCHKVEVFLPQKQIIVWIAKDESKPLVMRYDIIQKEVPSHIAKKISTKITWRDNSEIKETNFKFSPPSNCHKIPFLGEK